MEAAAESVAQRESLAPLAGPVTASAAGGLYYRKVGTGPRVVTLHGGLGLDHSYLREWLDPLADDYELVYFDQRGCGRSERPTDYSDIDHSTWVEDVESLARYLGDEPIVLLGHSYGAFLAQEFALAHPERLRGLVICSGAPVIDYPDVIMGNAQRRHPELMPDVGRLFQADVASDEELGRLLASVMPLYFHSYDEATAKRMHAQMRYGRDAFVNSAGRCLPNFNVLSRLPELEIPTLLLAGKHDWITPPAQGAQRIHDAVKGSELVVFEESGHYPFVEENALFLETVRGWLKRNVG